MELCQEEYQLVSKSSSEPLITGLYIISGSQSQYFFVQQDPQNSKERNAVPNETLNIIYLFQDDQSQEPKR